MHAELARVCAELGPDAAGLTLHVGVNTGHGIARMLGSDARMDYAVLGRLRDPRAATRIGGAVRARRTSASSPTG